MNTNKDGNTPVTAYHLVTQVGGERFALFTINRLELNLEMFNFIQGNPEVLFHLRQYETTRYQFTVDLQNLTKSGFQNGKQ